MKFFNKQETFGLTIIFIVLLAISIPNFVLSLKRSRDMIRKEDLGRMVTALGIFQARYKEFPKSTPDGKLQICYSGTGPIDIDKNGDGKIDIVFSTCEWGQDSYIGKLPRDPHVDRGVNYFYISNGNRYQLFTALEAKDDAEYNLGVLKRNIMCGNRVCNSGRSYSTTPLDITLEEYEIQINEKNK